MSPTPALPPSRRSIARPSFGRVSIGVHGRVMVSFAEGPFEMAIDPVNKILYSANIRAGVYALKLE